VSLIEVTEAPFIQAIMDIEVPCMVFGHAVLLGDAAFLLRPHTAATTVKAAADAIALGHELRATNKLDEALAQWNENQMEFGAKLLDYGLALGARSQGVSPRPLQAA